MKTPTTPDEWAEFIMEEAFAARVGVFHWDEWTIAFDNSPNGSDSQARRVERVREAMEALGARPELGWAFDEDNGPYTWALVAKGTLSLESIEAALWSGVEGGSFHEESFRTVVEALRLLTKRAA